MLDRCTRLCSLAFLSLAAAQVDAEQSKESVEGAAIAINKSVPKKTDVLQLEAIIRGNQQQPKVLTIVPWQSPEKRNALPSPVLQQVNRRLQPLERRNFLQEQRLFEKLSK
jgi:hypothetical protein